MRRCEAGQIQFHTHAFAEFRFHVVDGDPHSLSDRLKETTEDLEKSHPRLTLAIGAVADALSRLGI